MITMIIIMNNDNSNNTIHLFNAERHKELLVNK